MIGEHRDSYCLFGAKSLLNRLQNVAKEIDGVRKADDIERIHDMRVATRRMRSALALFEECLPGKKVKVWNKQMRRVTRALGTARDTDVQMDFLQGFLDGVTESRYRAGIQRLLLRLRQQRDSAQGKVLKAMDQLELSGVLEDMGKTLRRIRVHARMNHVDENAPFVYQQAYLTISLRLEDMLAYETYVTQPERMEELHAMRIAAKRLRYTMEVFEPLYRGDLKQPLKTVRKIQTMLGDIHDCDVWVEHLPQFLGEERARTVEYYGHARPLNRLKTGILYLQQERHEHRMELYREFVEFWQQTQEQNFWDNLLEQLSQPLSETLRTPPDVYQSQV
ncbi:CHAD domain-containing protein [Candidatus Poribacteria bacterium]